MVVRFPTYVDDNIGDYFSFDHILELYFQDLFILSDLTDGTTFKSCCMWIMNGGNSGGEGLILVECIWVLYQDQIEW